MKASLGLRQKVLGKKTRITRTPAGSSTLEAPKEAQAWYAVHAVSPIDTIPWAERPASSQPEPPVHDASPTEMLFAFLPVKRQADCPVQEPSPTEILPSVCVLLPINLQASPALHELLPIETLAPWA